MSRTFPKTHPHHTQTHYEHDKATDSAEDEDGTSLLQLPPELEDGTQDESQTVPDITTRTADDGGICQDRVIHYLTSILVNAQTESIKVKRKANV